MLLVKHHNSSPTFHGDSGQKTWIGVTAASSALAARIVDLAIDTSIEVASDHRLVVTRIIRKPRRTVV